MAFGTANRLAFCSPADCLRTSHEISILRKHEWTPMGDLYTLHEREDGETMGLCARVFEDLVHCRKRKAFCTMTPYESDLDSFWYSGQLNFWDPRISRWKEVGHSWIDVEKVKEKGKEGDTVQWVKENRGVLQRQCIQIPHIVYAEDIDQHYVALRFVILMNPDDGTTPVDKVPVCEFAGLRGCFPSRTVGFMVVKIIEGAGADIVDDIGGLAMFVGINHSFALNAADYPGLKPDSIYFADSKRLDSVYGRNDIGIFDYRNIGSGELR